MNNSRSEIAPILTIAVQDGNTLRFIYRGQSMAPTFSPGQILYVNTRFCTIEPGDVVVFRFKESESQVAHRVISISECGPITRGDNNLQIDLNPILPDQVIGRVEKADFRGRVRPVACGWRGLCRARFLRKRLLIKRLVRRGLGKPYWWLKCSGIVTKLWHPEIVTINFKTPDGPLVKYIHKGRTVASCWTDSNLWWFKRPYDFIIDPKRK
jgi:signal peptidase I